MRTPIEAITVCVDYGDYLAQVAPYNVRLLDRWVVVTRPQDEETRKVCQDHSITCVLCEDFAREGDGFAKAHGINAGLYQAHGRGWLLHLDADICLPYDMHPCLADAQLVKDSIYGCLRLCLPGWEAWQQAQQQGLYSRQQGWLVEYRDRPKGSYVGGTPAGLGHGYAPIGFWQLWHGSETHAWQPTRKWYPTHHSAASRTDTQFAHLWGRRQRLLVPELLVFHLESGAPVMMGENWKGRTSPRFGPPPADRAADTIIPPVKKGY